MKNRSSEGSPDYPKEAAIMEKKRHDRRILNEASERRGDCGGCDIYSMHSSLSQNLKLCVSVTLLTAVFVSCVYGSFFFGMVMRGLLWKGAKVLSPASSASNRAITYNRAIEHEIREQATKAGGNIPNVSCNSSIDQSKRHDIKILVPTKKTIRSTLGEVDVLQIMEHPLWKNDILSYHCTEETNIRGSGVTNHQCAGILRGGGHVFLRSAQESKSILLHYLTGCSIGNDTVSDITHFVEQVASILMGDDPNQEGRDEGGGGIMRDYEFYHVVRCHEFRDIDRSQWNNDPLKADLGILYLQMLNLRKKHIFSGRSKFQQIDVFDTIDPRTAAFSFQSYQKSLQGDGSYESEHRELFRPNRVVFLDGVEQSTRIGDESYHETLVHPGLFAHSNPQRVAIVGGGEGATLREVLRHDTVSHVKMIEIDEEMVLYSKKHLPEWNSCADIVGSADSCFDDPRSDVSYEDAMAWFIQRFYDGDIRALADDGDESSDDDKDEAGECDTREGKCDVAESSKKLGYESHGKAESAAEVNIEKVETFDVIIMDALDPTDNVAFADLLYNSDPFLSSLYSALSEDGILIMQLGEMPHSSHFPEEYGEDKNRASVKRYLQKLGFAQMYEYVEAHCGFRYPWNFLIACKSGQCHDKFFSNAAIRDVSIHRRMRRTVSGKPPLQFADAATLTSYQGAKASLQRMFCISPYAPADCDIGNGRDPKVSYFAGDNVFEVRRLSPSSNEADQNTTTGWGVFAKVDIPKLSYVDAGKPVYFEQASLEQMKRFTKVSLPIRGGQVESSGYFHPGLQELMEHAEAGPASGGGNVGTITAYLSRENKCEPLALEGQCHAPHNIVVHRNRAAYGGSVLLSLRDIPAGGQIVLEA